MTREKSPEETLQKGEKIAHLEAEVIDTAAGAVAGALVGAIGGPIGAAAGAAMGAAIGAAIGLRQDEDEHKATLHDRELDAIGVQPPSNEEYKKFRDSQIPPPPETKK
jgi:phage tail tape-measure protein